MRTISQTRATVDSLVSNPRWNTVGFSGCCGARILSRLGAGYYDPTSVDLKYVTLGSTDVTIHRLAGRIRNNNASRGERMHSSTVPSNVPNHPLPLELCFTAVLQAMRDDMGTYSQLWLATDNVTGCGDVHNGPFSTRNFMQWLKDNDLAVITESRRVGANVAYTIVLNRRAMYNKVRRGVTTFNRLMRTCKGDSEGATAEFDYIDDDDDYEEMW